MKVESPKAQNINSNMVHPGATIAFIALRGQERETRTDQKVGWAPEEDGGWVG